MGHTTRKIGDINIAIEQAGTGPDLLFIGGTHWDLRVRPGPLESLLTEAFTVTLFDQRGMGLTDKPAGPYTMAQYAADAAGVIDAMGLDKPAVAGYSFGGMVAQELAIRFPEKISALVLAATAAGGAGGASFPLHTLTGLDQRAHAIRSIEISDTGFTDHWRAANPGDAEERIRLRMEKDARFADEPGMKDGAAAQLEARSHHDTFDRLGSIKIPTLVLCGDRDGLASAQASGNMANAITHCEHRTISGSHGFLHESDDGYAAIRDFFSRVIDSGQAIIEISGVDVSPDEITAAIAPFTKLSGDYRIVLDGANPTDALPLLLELAPGAVESVDLRPRITVKMERALGVTVQVSLVSNGDLPAASESGQRITTTIT